MNLKIKGESEIVRPKAGTLEGSQAKRETLSRTPHEVDQALIILLGTVMIPVIGLHVFARWISP